MASMNPATNLPPASILQMPTDTQAEFLSTERQYSTIPRADTEESQSWLYPSPRMFHNALARKGKAVEPSAIDSMLAVHNELNESVWQEVLSQERSLNTQCGDVKLKRFMGRPDDLSPTAWWHVKVRGGKPPFDRHDWTIDRCGCEIRYVIDYYINGRDQDEDISFNVHVRPALDSPAAILDRFRLWWNSKKQ